MTYIGNLTFELRDNATDLAHIWLNVPCCRREFGKQELDDLREASLKLNLLLSVIEASAQPRLKVVG